MTNEDKGGRKSRTQRTGEGREEEIGRFEKTEGKEKKEEKNGT